MSTEASQVRHGALSQVLSRLVLGDDSGVVSAPRDTEQGRALLQGRLAHLARLNLGLSLLFLGCDLALALFTSIPGTLAMAGAHATVIVLNLGVLLAARRRQASDVRLLGIDFVGSWGNCLVFVAMTWALPIWARPELVQLICLNLILGLRAFLIPSSAGRTCAIATLPVLAVAASTYARYTLTQVHPDAPSPASLTLLASLFGLANIMLTSLTSRTIFGLRERVREAAQLGQYTLLEKIGEGGMGIVYKASHAMLRRPTAIKLLPPQRAGEQSLARFEREVQLTSALTHPNTVAIYDYGRSADGLLYYAMEYLDGLDLESVVALTGPQDPARVVHILLQVSGALAEAHAAGLIHRDVKPGNILLCRRGGVNDVAKVVDFGLVKELAAPSQLSSSAIDQIVGTPLFMSPEAIVRPGELEPSSDLYALGAVAYYLLSGQPPFTGGSVVEVCGHHLHSTPVPPSVRLGRALPAQLEELVMRCLAKSPSDRPESAGKLGEQLGALHAGAAWTAQQAERWWREHEHAVAAHKRRNAEPGSGESPLGVATVAIDLRARGAQRGPWHSAATEPALELAPHERELVS